MKKIEAIFDMEMYQQIHINVKEYHILYYIHRMPPACTCFGHTCGYPQGGVYKGYITKM
jgi:DNA-binding MarR family transcriptional regulator